MNKFISIAILLSTFSLNLWAADGEKIEQNPHPFKSSRAFVVASKFVPNDGKTDASAAIQKLIDDNPNRTIYFPDGTYLLSRPICTPAEPKRSVMLVLDNYAVIKAADTWNDEEALVRLGAIHPANNISVNGSNYGFSGGIIDGSGKANGISIDGGRETVIRNVSIKHTKIGIHIKRGANSGSSDADIRDVNICGTNSADSIGLLIEGFDNTATNMRIANVVVGVLLKSSGNSLRNIHPLYIFDKDISNEHYQKGYGFIDIPGMNWYNYCYSDQFATGFKVGVNPSIFNNCFAFWYKGDVPFQIAFQCDGKFNSIVTDFNAGFHPKSKTNIMLKAKKEGDGVFQNLIYRQELAEKDVLDSYFTGKLIKRN